MFRCPVAHVKSISQEIHNYEKEKPEKKGRTMDCSTIWWHYISTLQFLDLRLVIVTDIYGNTGSICGQVPPVS